MDVNEVINRGVNNPAVRTSVVPGVDVTQAFTSPGLPIFQGGPTQEYVKATNAVQTGQVQYQEDILKQRAAMEQSVREKNDAITGQGDASAAVTMANQQRAQQVADMVQQIVQLNNVDPANPTSTAVRNVMDISAKTDEALKLRDGITEMQSVGFLDNPIEYLVNQFTLPSAVSKYNATVNEVNVKQQQLDNAISTANNLKTLTADTIPSITRAQADASAKLELKQAAERVADTNIMMAQQNSQFAASYFQATIANAQVQKGMSDAKGEAAWRTFQSQVEGIKYAESAERRMAETAKAVDYLKEHKILEEAAKAAATAWGWDPTKFSVSQFERLPKDLQLRFMAGGASGIYDLKPYEAFKSYELLHGPNMPENRKAAYERLGSIITAVEKNADRPGNAEAAAAKQKGAEAYQRYLSIKVNEALQLQKDSSSTDPNSLFHSLAPQVLLSRNQAFANSPAGKILEPYKAASVIPTDQQVVDTLVVSMAKENASPQAIGSAIADYFKLNVGVRNGATDLKAFAIKAPTDYTIPLNVPGRSITGGRSMQFNITDAAEATRYVIAKQAAEIGGRASVEMPLSPEFTTRQRPPKSGF